MHINPDSKSTENWNIRLSSSFIVEMRKDTVSCYESPRELHEEEIPILSKLPDASNDSRQQFPRPINYYPVVLVATSFLLAIMLVIYIRITMKVTSVIINDDGFFDDDITDDNSIFSGEFNLTSPAFEDNDFFPFNYTCESSSVRPFVNHGPQNNPPLTWSHPPQKTKDFLLTFHSHILTMTDNWIKYDWSLYNIGANLRSIPTNIATGDDDVISGGTFNEDGADECKDILCLVSFHKFLFR